MGKSSRRKKERRKSGPKSPLGLELRGMTSPLADIPRHELAGMMAKFGKNQAEKFASSTIAIGDLMSRIDPLHLLACLMAYGITDFIDADGLPSHGEKIRLYPAHVELAQMMALTLPPAVRPPALSQEVGSMFETLPKWTDQFHWKRLSQVEQAATDVERARIAVQEQMRVTTQMIRSVDPDLIARRSSRNLPR